MFGLVWEYIYNPLVRLPVVCVGAWLVDSDNCCPVDGCAEAPFGRYCLITIKSVFTIKRPI
jgi:hypothetical protein